MLSLNHIFRVSVCPPQDTSTNLNKDLVNAENATLNKDARDAMIKLAADLIEEYGEIEVYEELKSLKEENLWKNWYLGYTKLMFPWTYTGVRRYRVETTQTSGFFSTPYFGRHFEDDTCFHRTKTNFYIYLHPNITTLGGNLTMVMKVQIDTKETMGGYDYASIDMPAEDKKRFQYTGYLNETWHYPLDEKYDISFRHDVDTDSYEKWSDKRMTGFSLAWHIENSTGHMVDIQPWQDYKQDERNIEFVRLANILHQAVTEKNITVQDIWEDVKIFRGNWLEVEKSKISTQCVRDMVKTNIIENFLDEEESKLDIVKIAEPKYNVTETILETTVKMYTYLTYCPPPMNFIWKNFYADLFERFSPRFILQTLSNFTTMNTGGTKKRNIPYNLLSRLDKYLHLEFEKINLAMDKKSSLLLKIRSGLLHKYATKFTPCANKKKCNELVKVLNELGDLLLALNESSCP